MFLKNKYLKKINNIIISWPISFFYFIYLNILYYFFKRTIFLAGDLSRIGVQCNLISMVRSYYSENPNGQKPIVIFYAVSNLALHSIVKKKCDFLHLSSGSFQLLKKNSNDKVFLSPSRWIKEEPYKLDVYNDKETYLTLNENINRFGNNELKSFFKKEIPWFITFHCRDSAYLEKYHSGIDWSHHNYRDANIENYLPAVSKVIGTTGAAFRMGKEVSKPLPDISNENIIDYASSSHSDEMDIFLIAKAKFHLGSTTGLSDVAEHFGTPVALANCAPIVSFGKQTQGLWIPMLLRDRSSGKFLTLSELKKIGFFDFQNPTFTNGAKIDELGLEYVENSAVEIIDLCDDMIDLLDGIKSSDEIQLLQKQYKEDYVPHISHIELAPNIAPRFIQRHIELFTN